MRTLWREWRIAYYSWAEREIDPMHPDVSHVATRLVELRAERHTRTNIIRAAWRWL